MISPDYDPFEIPGYRHPRARGTQQQEIQPALDVDNARAIAARASEFLRIGDPERGGGIKKRARPVDHNPRTKEYFERLGYLVFKVELTRVLHGGTIITTDLLEVADYIALKPGRMLLIQACAAGQYGAHLRKFRDLPHMRTLLTVPGIKVVMAVWDQPAGKGTKWNVETTQVTAEILDAYEARKRK